MLVNGINVKEVPVSNRIKKLADRFMLDVTAFIEANYNGHGGNRKVYKFSGNFLANFEALSKEAKGYDVDPAWGQGYLRRRNIMKKKHWKNIIFTDCEGDFIAYVVENTQDLKDAIDILHTQAINADLPLEVLIILEKAIEHLEEKED